MRTSYVCVLEAGAVSCGCWQSYGPTVQKRLIKLASEISNEKSFLKQISVSFALSITRLLHRTILGVYSRGIENTSQVFAVKPGQCSWLVLRLQFRVSELITYQIIVG